MIPAYNEALAIEPVIEEIRKRHPDFEIIVVDDFSTDETAKLAEAAGATVLRHPYNKGNGAAVKTGMRAARGDVVLMMDADGQHKPEDIQKLLDLMDQGYDMVVGARTRDSDTSLHRDLANGIYNRLASYMAHFRIPDLTSGFRAIRRPLAQMFVYLLPNTFSYPTTITLALIRSGYSVGYVPIQAPKRVGRSKIRLLSDGTRFLLIILKISTLVAPLRIFLPVSVTFFLAGLGLYLWRVWIAHEFRFTNMAILLLSTSVVIFLVGLVAEQIAALRLERSR